MKAKEYLKQLGLLEARINNMKAELGMVRMSSQNVQGIDYSVPKVQVSHTGDAIGKNAARCLHLEQEIENMIKKSASLKRDMAGRINSLDNAVFVKILFMKYVETRKLTEIADEIGYSYQYTRRLHGYALQSFTDHNRGLLD